MIDVLKAERMSKVVVTAPKSFIEPVIGELYRFNAMHIISHVKSELDIGSPLESASRISEILVVVRALISKLSLQDEARLSNGFRALGVKNFAQLAKAVRLLQEDVNSRLEDAKRIGDELKVLDSKVSILSVLCGLPLSLEAYVPYSSISAFVGFVDSPELLRSELSVQTDEFELFSSGAKFVALFVPNSFRDRASGLLSANGFSELSLSLVGGLKGSPSLALDSLRARRSSLLKSQESISRQLVRLSQKWHDFLLLSDAFLSAELEKAESPLRFASSQNIFVVSGWVPDSGVDMLLQRIAMVTKGSVDVVVEAPHHGEDVPVKLSNPAQVKPFEFFMNLYALPRYWEIDPTVFMSFTFPLFFGIILGDVGYGAVTVFLLLFLSRKFPSAAPLAKVVMPAAFSSMFFGMLFGEFFGFEELFGFEIPHVISRVHQIKEMLMVSIAIGLVHVNAGIILGFLNELRHGLRKAVLVKGSWLVMEAGAALLALSVLNVVALPSYFGALLLVAGFVMLLLGEPMEVVEIPGIVSNVLSYSRLMAVGLASVGLAVVVNGFVEDFASSGGLMLIPAILVGIVGHSLNIALGLLGGFLHSLRLHYVEFFTKFFKGGAIPFQPFGKKIEEVF
ncbi:V-type ATP synthase subunit I [Candidatus Woesearchaeota archaeon]|nr:V-type ATP synthase subunit I [Candidatus Woesearchaeota archaeon]